MLKKWICILVCGSFLLSCSDRSYRGDADTEEFVYEPLPVMVVVGDPENLFTKGSGAIDADSDTWGGAPFYVYSFRKDLSTLYTSMSSDGDEKCLVDASLDTPGSLSGKKAYVSELDSYATWAGPEKTVYYPDNVQPYDFFVYYIDDMEIPDSRITRTETSISFPVEIDGSQDLMSAKAELTDAQLDRDGLSEEERYNILNYAYSVYTAQQNIQPVVYFKHHLVRLCFYVYPHFTEDSGKQMFVEAIEVRSRTRGVFTVADRAAENIGVDFSSDGTAPDQLPLLSLKGPGGTDLIPEDEPDKYLIPPYTGDPNAELSERTPIRIGESILAAPASEYEVHLHLKEIARTGAVYRYDKVEVITLPSGDFQPGNQYSVRFSLYGMTEVKVNVGLVPWGDGGDITIDEDRPPAG